MGPTLALMALRAMKAAGKAHAVTAVSAFPIHPRGPIWKKRAFKPLSCDLLDRTAVAQLTDCPNIIFLAGQKIRHQ